MEDNKYYYQYFTLDFDKISKAELGHCISILFYSEEHSELYAQEISYHILGNYIMWSDGSTTLYFTKKYLRINGHNFFSNSDIGLMFSKIKNYIYAK
ncbi:hypothetical protein HYO65_gp123 [Tenacibaculum phage PTm1]|uniref:Uncharacterized protein n=2 Tax=Shirahamavirus PTm1 TaxID=2846435 RepID=A0A5S9HX84_9CAUD|nr:hypothetical protein HYO65_gp123 [Tenacibaculum phage PTm1]BBI90515.1 hypothetical protein [Tenacibaculum phage PTm1]BBI90823.1 hypothetical protein [Tenacibaculum phage PTm5]